LQEFALLLGNPAEYFDERTKKTLDVPVCMKEMAKVGLGPTEAELKELEGEFKELVKAHRALLASSAGRVPGSEEDSHAETYLLLSARLAADISPLDRNAGLEGLVRELASLQSIREAVAVPGRSLKLVSQAVTVGEETQATISLPVDGASESLLDAIKQAVLAGLMLGPDDLSVKAAGTRVYIYRLGDEEVCGIRHEVAYTRMQARRLRTLRELMATDDAVRGKLRVEEAIVAYQYTGPLFQASDASETIVLRIFYHHQ
jgi:hypothetical protein